MSKRKDKDCCTFRGKEGKEGEQGNPGKQGLPGKDGEPGAPGKSAGTSLDANFFFRNSETLAYDDFITFIPGDGNGVELLRMAYNGNEPAFLQKVTVVWKIGQGVGHLTIQRFDSSGVQYVIPDIILTAPAPSLAIVSTTVDTSMLAYVMLPGDYFVVEVQGVSGGFAADIYSVTFNLLP